jgi:hypothetical protein
VTLEDAIEAVIARPTQSSDRLQALADYVKDRLADHGLPGAIGGTGGELCVPGLARQKDWDVAYEFAGKYRLLISLKSMWKNAAGTVPNRIDDHIGEIANVQQLRPEIVIGYVVLFDVSADSRRRHDGLQWSEFFEQAIARIAIRKAPLWNQGLLEGAWFIRFDSRRPFGDRIVNQTLTNDSGIRFFNVLLAELKLREPAIPFSKRIITPALGDQSPLGPKIGDVEG